MDGGKLFLHMDAQALNDHIQHGLSVQHGEPLGNAHIVQILPQQLPFHISQRLRDMDRLGLQFLQGLLNLSVSALGFQLCDFGFNLFGGHGCNSLQHVGCRLFQSSGHV